MVEGRWREQERRGSPQWRLRFLLCQCRSLGGATDRSCALHADKSLDSRNSRALMNHGGWCWCQAGSWCTPCVLPCRSAAPRPLWASAEQSWGSSLSCVEAAFLLAFTFCLPWHRLRRGGKSLNRTWHLLFSGRKKSPKPKIDNSRTCSVITYPG